MDAEEFCTRQGGEGLSREGQPILKGVGTKDPELAARECLGSILKSLACPAGQFGAGE